MDDKKHDSLLNRITIQKIEKKEKESPTVEDKNLSGSVQTTLPDLEKVLDEDFNDLSVDERRKLRVNFDHWLNGQGG